MSIVNNYTNKPKITPQDLKPANGREMILINFAITMLRKLKKPLKSTKIVSGMLISNEQENIDHELVQFGLKFDGWPIPESHVDKSIRNMGLQVKKTLRENGLMK